MRTYIIQFCDNRLDVWENYSFTRNGKTLAVEFANLNSACQTIRDLRNCPRFAGYTWIWFPLCNAYNGKTPN